MPADYGVLSTIQDEIGLDAFARHMTPQIVNFALRNDWTGRQVADIGCGSGVSLRWLAQHGYVVTGIDSSPEMLNTAKQVVASQSLNVKWEEQNILDMENIGGQDLALSIDTMHEFANLRELEQAFRNIHAIVRDTKLFIFDMYTIEGLVHRNSMGDLLEFDSNRMSIFIQNDFDYERQIQTRKYIIYRKQPDNSWQRQDAERVLRAYPVQAITTLVGRSGFNINYVLNTNLTSHRPGESTERVIIVAQKE